MNAARKSDLAKTKDCKTSSHGTECADSMTDGIKLANDTKLNFGEMLLQINKKLTVAGWNDF